jgi:hypothetical protein
MANPLVFERHRVSTHDNYNNPSNYLLPIHIEADFPSDDFYHAKGGFLVALFPLRHRLASSTFLLAFKVSNPQHLGKQCRNVTLSLFPAHPLNSRPEMAAKKTTPF